MAAWRSVLNISLASKVRLLFGLAVLLIITAALAMPFYRMEVLVQERSLSAARMAAAVHLAYSMHEVYFEPDREGLRLADASQFIPRPLELFTLEPGYQLQATRFVPLVQGELEVTSDDEFASRAATAFRTRPSTPEIFNTREGVFQYATLIRASSNCLSCHSQGAVDEVGRERARALDFVDDQIVGMITTELPTRDLGEQNLWNRTSIFAAGTLACLLAIVVFYIITSKLILAPVHELTQVAERVSHGDLKVRSTVSTGDDYELLANSFNQMLAHLQLNQEELAAANNSLNQRLDDLARANSGLFEANRLKSEFVSNVSHELRTPLNSIIGFADLLLNEAGEPKLKRYSEHIRTSGQRLLELINDLLDLAKIEAGRMELRIGPTSVIGLCTDMADFFRPQVLKKSLELRLDIPDRMPLLETDGAKVRQILYNLMSNAIKFTPEGGQVTVTAADQGSLGVTISVADTGPGIDPAFEDQIFEKFRQADAGMTRKHTGTGLGLAISRELALMLGGRLQLTNRPGLGAAFTLYLPRHPPAGEVIGEAEEEERTRVI